VAVSASGGSKAAYFQLYA